MFNRRYHVDKSIVRSFLIDDKWIFLGIPLKGNFLAEVGHSVNMLHPEFINSSKCETTLEFCELLFRSAISYRLDLARKKRLCLLEESLLCIVVPEMLNISYRLISETIDLINKSYYHFGISFMRK